MKTLNILGLFYIYMYITYIHIYTHTRYRYRYACTYISTIFYSEIQILPAI